MIVVLTGVTASGKTTIGKLLARRMGVTFADADDYHSEANKRKMAAGHALNDADRQPWLEALHGLLQGWQRAGQGGVLACSALKEGYRRTLVAEMPKGAVRFVLLNVPRKELERRLAERQGSFMNPNLLESQIETLETPGEDAVTVENSRNEDEVVAEILAKLKR